MSNAPSKDHWSKMSEESRGTTLSMSNASKRRWSKMTKESRREETAKAQWNKMSRGPSGNS